MAISTINAKNETISVTGNGLKTRAQLFNELYALVDMSKVTEKTVVNMFSGVYKIGSISNSVLVFDLVQSQTNALWLEEVQMSQNSKIYNATISSSGYSRTDDSDTVIQSGRVIKLVY